MNLTTLPNAHPELLTRIALIQPMPQMCPQSGNPQLGSVVTIQYVPAAKVLEVHSVLGYLKTYVGGRTIEDTTVIRDMEQTLQQIALDCAAVLGVDVIVVGDLVLRHEQRMCIEVQA